MTVQLFTQPQLRRPNTKSVTQEAADNADEMLKVMDRIQPEIHVSLQSLASRLWVSTAETSNPPTSAELDAAFGRKEEKRDGFAAWVDSSGTGQLVCLVACVQNKWWYVRTLESGGDTDSITLIPNIDDNDRAYFSWDGSTTAINRSGWTVTASENSVVAGNAIDGNTSTRWLNSPNMDGNEIFTVDMGSSQDIGGVHLLNYGQSNGYPRQWRVETSADDLTYTAQLSGNSTSYPDSTRQHSLQSENAQQNGLIRLYFKSPITCRYIKIYQLGTVAHNWSIHELNVVEPLPTAALFSAGEYTVRYVEGAMQYDRFSDPTGQNFSIHDGYTADQGFYIEHSEQGGTTQAPGELSSGMGVQYDNSSDALATADVESGSGGDVVAFTHTGGPIGMWLFDSAHSDNAANTRSVKFSLGTLATGGPEMPALKSVPAFIFPPPVFQEEALERFFLELGSAFADNYRNIYQDLFNWTTHIDTSLNNVTDGGPTQAELDAAFGTPGQARQGFTAVVDDAGAKARVWVVTAVNDKWWTLAMTAAA
jgi:hypothetical protein